MYKLFYSPGSAAMAPQAMLEEIGAAYELIKVDTAARQHDGAEYRKLNPNGRIPVLLDGDFPVFETAAICQYLAEKHPEAALMPEAGQPRALFLQWLTFMTNTVQVAFLDWYHPDWKLPDAAGQALIKGAAARELARAAQVLEDGLPGGSSVLAGGFSAADIYLTMLVRWSRSMERPLWLWPKIRAVAAATYPRPAFQRMMQKQGIAWAENWPG